MNPRDYRTWTSLADHPIFSARATSYADWSSDPDVYSDRRDLPAAYTPDWYVHIDPRYPTDVQAECAASDLRNLSAVCDSLAQRFGNHSHELFILDDLTVYVHVVADDLVLNIYPVHFDDAGTILKLFLESPAEHDELTFTSIEDVVPKLDSLLHDACRRTT